VERRGGNAVDEHLDRARLVDREAQDLGDPVEIPVDLIVPEGPAPLGGSRGARLGPHGKQAARKAIGLEAALFDNDLLMIDAFEPSDGRRFESKVAGADGTADRESAQDPGPSRADRAA
jgi:hypothetical protein